MLPFRKQRGRSRAGRRLLALSVIATLTQFPGGIALAADTDGRLPQIATSKRAENLIQPATVFVEAEWDASVVTPEGREQPLSMSSGCTGTVVSSNGYMVTAGHCLDPKSATAEYYVDREIEAGEVSAAQRENRIGSLRIEGQTPGSEPVLDVHVQLGGGHAIRHSESGSATGAKARVVSVKPYTEGDVGLLKVEQRGLPVAKLSPQSDVQEQQDVLAIGYPFGLSMTEEEVALTARSGKINSTDTTGQGGPGDFSYATDADLTNGMSGGATVDTQGRVIGLSSSQSIEGEANYIVPSAVVSEVLTSRGVKNELGSLDLTYRMGLKNLYDGYYSDAIKKFDEVLDAMPDNKAAQENKAQAVEWKQQYGDQPKPKSAPVVRDTPGAPVALIVGVGAAVVLLAIGAFALLRSRRRRRGSGSPPAGNGPPPAGYVPGDQPPAAPGDYAQGGAGGTPQGFGPPRGRDRPTTTIRQDTVAAAAGQPAHCPRCGRAHRPGAVFCSHCGNRLTGGQAGPGQGGPGRATPGGP